MCVWSHADDSSPVWSLVLKVAYVVMKVESKGLVRNTGLAMIQTCVTYQVNEDLFL
jgi:hypothetical protein